MSIEAIGGIAKMAGASGLFGGGGESGGMGGMGGIGAIVEQVSSALSGLFGNLFGKNAGGESTSGARGDFSAALKSALTDMVEGSRAAEAEGKRPMDNAQFKSGLEALLALLGKKDEKTAEKGAPAEAPAGGAPAAAPEAAAPAAGGAASESDKIKELIRMLLAMGASPEMIQQLLGALGIAPQEAQQMIAEVQQQSPQAGASASQGAQPTSNVVGKFSEAMRV